MEAISTTTSAVVNTHGLEPGWLPPVACVLILVLGACMTTHTSSKIEPRLRDALEREKAAARIPVIIVYQAPPSGDTTGSIEEVERRQQPVVDQLRARLRELGVTGEVQTLPLARGVAVELTPAQIRALAPDPLVKQLLSNREEKVIP